MHLSTQPLALVVFFMRLLGRIRFVHGSHTAPEIVVGAAAGGAAGAEGVGAVTGEDAGAEGVGTVTGEDAGAEGVGTVTGEDAGAEGVGAVTLSQTSPMPSPSVSI
jgi:hypothetical protein